MHKISKKWCNGITLIEILVVLAMLLIIASFAAPSFSSATARADMRVATENLLYSIQIARNTARMTESTVTMNIGEEEHDGLGQRITFTVSESGLRALGRPGLQENRLPSDVKMVSDYPSFEFDGRGIVQNPGEILLVSRSDESRFSSLRIN